MRIFKNYYEAVMYAGENGITNFKVKKHPSRINTMYNWYIINKKGKPVK
jgi:hypothetical protein